LLLGGTAALCAPAILRAQTLGPGAPAIPGIVPSNRFALRLRSHWPAAVPSAGVANSTLYTLEAAPSWVRFVFTNDETSPITVSGAAVALSSTVNDGYTPTDQTGTPNTALFQPVTFANLGASVDPQFQPGGTTPSIVQRPNPGEVGYRPSQMVSDWVQFRTPNPRTDGGAGALLMCRTLGALTGPGSAAEETQLAALGRTLACYNTSSNGAAAVASPFSFAGATLAYNTSPFQVDYIAAASGATVMGCGDSIDDNCASYVNQACFRISTPAYPVSPIGDNRAGSQTWNFLATGSAMLQSDMPIRCVVIEVFSRNDGSPATQALAAGGWNAAMALADQAQRMGVKVILCTTAPYYYNDSSSETWRVWSNGMVRGSGYPFLDLDAVWGAGTNPNSYQSQFNSGDNTHPNMTGLSAASIVLAPILQQVLTA
jgi:hypothetical protein